MRRHRAGRRIHRAGRRKHRAGRRRHRARDHWARLGYRAHRGGDRWSYVGALGVLSLELHAGLEIRQQAVQLINVVGAVVGAGPVACKRKGVFAQDGRKGDSPDGQMLCE